MIKPIHCRDVIDWVYEQKNVREPVSHDGWTPGFIDSKSVGYLGAWVENRFCGFFMIREISQIDLEIHACLLRQAIPHSRVLGIEVLEKVFSASSIKRVSAPIIGNLVSAQNYVKKLGFVHEGRLRSACQKDGELLDVELYGLLRADFEREQRHELHHQRHRQRSWVPDGG